MNCNEVTDVRPRYLSGELDSAQAAAMADHLRDCQACARDHQLDMLLRRGILAEAIDASGLESRVRGRIRRGLVLRRAALGAIAAVLIAAIGISLTMRRAADPLYIDAVQDHEDEVVQGKARHWISGEQEIAALAARQGVPKSAIDAVARAGYRIARARLCRLNGRIFLHLVYNDDSHEFSVFLRRADQGEASTTRILRAGSEWVAGLEMPALAALVVTPQRSDAARINGSLRAVL